MTGQPYPNTPADATTGDLAAALVSAGASQSINQKLLGCPSARACLKSKTPLLDTSRRSRWAATDPNGKSSCRLCVTWCIALGGLCAVGFVVTPYSSLISY